MVQIEGQRVEGDSPSPKEELASPDSGPIELRL